MHIDGIIIIVVVIVVVVVGKGHSIGSGDRLWLIWVRGEGCVGHE